MELYSVTGKNELNEVYDYVKKLGSFHENDGVLLLRVYGDADKSDILFHLKEAMELFNNPIDDAKTNEPTCSYYSTDFSPNKS